MPVVSHFVNKVPYARSLAAMRYLLQTGRRLKVIARHLLPSFTRRGGGENGEWWKPLRACLTPTRASEQTEH